MRDLDELLVPVEGEPGVRFDPATGETAYSAAWLGDERFAARAAQPLEALIAAGFEQVGAVASVPTAETHALESTDELDRRRRLAVVRAQAETRPADGNVGPSGAASRVRPLDPAGRPAEMPDDLSAESMARRLVLGSLDAAIRHAERLETLVDPADEAIVRVRRRKIENLRALFEDDPARLA